MLECEIHPTEVEEEAPFSEYPGAYGPQRIKIARERIGRRRNRLFDYDRYLAILNERTERG